MQNMCKEQDLVKLFEGMKEDTCVSWDLSSLGVCHCSGLFSTDLATESVPVLILLSQWQGMSWHWWYQTAPMTLACVRKHSTRYMRVTTRWQYLERYSSTVLKIKAE